MSEERNSWTVKEAEIHAELVQLMALTPEEIAALGELREQAAGQAKPMTEAFYSRLTAHPNTLEFFTGVDLGHMHQVTGQWFTELFGGLYDAAYVARRLTIGTTHVRIGLPVRYPLAMLDIISEHGYQVAAQSDRPDLARQAFRKVLALDVAVFNQAYEDNQLKHLSELVGGERLARRLLAGVQ